MPTSIPNFNFLAPVASEPVEKCMGRLNSECLPSPLLPLPFPSPPLSLPLPLLSPPLPSRPLRSRPP